MSDPTPSESTLLARQRTLLALERSMLAWVRTAVSLISFGFTIYKFFDYLQHQQPNLPAHPFGPREFAIAMIAGGLLVLVLSAVEYRRSRIALIASTGSHVHASLAIVTAVIVAGLGIGGLVLAILRQ